MKRQNVLQRLLIFLFVGLLISFNGGNVSAKVMDNDGALDGDWKEGLKSMSIEIPITVSINGSLLTIQCTSGRSDIKVRITNDAGVSIEKTVPSSEAYNILIDLADTPKENAPIVHGAM